MKSAFAKWGILVLAIAAIAVVGAAVMSVSSARSGDTPTPPQGEALIAGLNDRIASDPDKSRDLGSLTRDQKGVFSVTAGDPVDVDLLKGKGRNRCLAVAGDAYGSGASCFDIDEASKDGAYIVAYPVKDGPILVVGYMPGGTSRVTVGAPGATSSSGSVRGKLFVATLPSGALGPNNAARVTVAFG